jgi:mRNA-degrading endonuclease toxin of MazEF toxin-antitoxin module
MFKKGEIYLARLNPRKGNEVGKVRPVFIYQTDMLNDIGHPTTIILPLSTHQGVSLHFQNTKITVPYLTHTAYKVFECSSQSSLPPLKRTIQALDESFS